MELLRTRLSHYRTRLGYLSPENQIREKQMRVAQLQDSMSRAMEERLKEERYRLSLYAQKLDGLSPLKKLQQGFSYVENGQGKAIISIRQVEPGQELKIQVTDGTIEAQVLTAAGADRGGTDGADRTGE